MVATIKKHKPAKTPSRKISSNNCTKILLVDDDNIFRSEFKECFNEYGIKEAASAVEALDILRKPNEIDLIILDVRMQGMSGLEALAKIKKISPSVAIIISTAYSSKDIAIEALRGKADEYIEKPLDIDRTKDIIEKLLEVRGGPADISACTISDKMDKVKRFIERNCFKKISLNDAANAVFLSPKYLSRIFKQCTGVGFSDFRLNIKIDRAKELLEKTGYKIDQISDKLEYQNTESFIRQFKKLTSLTPTQYRTKATRSNKHSRN
ncbi:MAG: response regulator [Candidatus Omnitrophota bacterium]|jgi:two-component system response regulator YesN